MDEKQSTTVYHDQENNTRKMRMKTAPPCSVLISQWDLKPIAIPSVGFMLKGEIKEVAVAHPCPLPCQRRAPIMCQNTFKILKIAAKADW